MDIYRLKDLPADQRTAILEGERWEEQVYMKPLDEGELAGKHEELAQACIKKSSIEAEKKETMKEFKDRIDPLSREIVKTVEAIKNRAIEVTGRLYSISDFDNQMIHTLDEGGHVLASRRMKPEERQLSIHSNLKAS